MLACCCHMTTIVKAISWSHSCLKRTGEKYMFNASAKANIISLITLCEKKWCKIRCGFLKLTFTDEAFEV